MGASAKEDAQERSSAVVCTTLGMYINDIFDFGSERPPIPDQVGGGGTYVTIAARMWLSPEQLGMIIDRGGDWREDIQRQLDSYGPCWVFRDDKSRLTTRARATYKGETRGFEYLTPKIRLSPPDLAPTRLAAPRYLHCVCSPTRVLEIIKDIDSLGWTNKTKIVYEPIPDLCIPSEMPALKAALPRLHILSPNHEEAGTFFGESIEEQEAEGKPQKIEQLAQIFLDLGLRSIIIIRSGKLGAYVKQSEDAVGLTNATTRGLWVPAYYQNGSKVVDVTGAGNAFLGGLMAGLYLEKENVQQACLYGSVSSSYVIEQYGLPSIDAAGRWNSADTPKERLDSMRRRLDI